MQFQKKEKRQTTVRFDSHHVRLRTGEVQRKTGSYMFYPASFWKRRIQQYSR